MRLLYDSSLLGIGYRNKMRSGLVRAAEDLLFALVEIEEIRIALCSSLSFEVWKNCQKYADENATISQLEFVRKGGVRGRVYEKIDELINNIDLNQFIIKLFNINFDPLFSSNINEIDIYHSPYHALPKIVKQSPRLQCFLTVHDVIPMLHPEWFGLRQSFAIADFDAEFNLLQAIESLSKEDWIICPSASTKNDLWDCLYNKIDIERIFVIPWAASALCYRCQDRQLITLTRQKYGIPEGPYIFSLSTLEPRKNLEHAIRCFAHLVAQENVPDLSLVLAGSLGWNYEPIFRELAQFKELQERIIFAGYVADEDIAPLYSDALVFVYPSFYEGFGLPPLEAMQCGTPVITANTSSLPEVVGDAGIMLDPLDQDGLCQNILAIYRDATLHKELSIKSIEQAQRFSWSQCAQRTLDAYHRALA